MRAAGGRPGGRFYLHVGAKVVIIKTCYVARRGLPCRLGDDGKDGLYALLPSFTENRRQLRAGREGRAGPLPELSATSRRTVPSIVPDEWPAK